jgi:hypothetical protein
MAEAPNILLYLLILLLPAALTFQETFVLIELLLLRLGACWTLGGLHKMRTIHHVHPPSQRCSLRRQHHLRPKHQYRYHWFKARMKRKKKKKFRKPPPLYHLTWKYKLFKLTLAFIIGSLKVGCCVERFISSSCWFLHYCFWLLHHDIVSTACKTTKYLHLHLPSFAKLYSSYPIGDFVAFKSNADIYPPVRTRFDTDSFRIGVDTLASCTMSGNKECFENLMLISNGPVVDGFAGNKAKIAGEGTFCFKIEDSKGRLHTIKLPNSAYIPGMKLTLLCPQHWAEASGDDEDGGKLYKWFMYCDLATNEGQLPCLA